MKPQFFGFWPIFTAHDSSFFIFTPVKHLRWSFLRKSLYVELSSERVSIFIFTGSYILEITLTNFQPLSLFCSAAIGNFQSRQILLWIVFFTGVILFVRQLLIQNRQWNFKINLRSLLKVNSKINQIDHDWSHFGVIFVDAEDTVFFTYF